MKFILTILALILSVTVNAQTIIKPSHTTLWNNYEQVVVHHDYIFGVAKQGVNVLSYDLASDYLQDHKQLLLTGSLRELKVFEQYAVVKTSENKLHIVDISNLPEIDLLGTIDVEDEIADYICYQDELYVSLWYDGVARFALNNIFDAQLLDVNRTPVLATDLYQGDDKLFVLDRYNGIIRFDLNVSGFGLQDAFLPIDRIATTLVPADTLFFILLDEGGFLISDFITGGSSFVDSIPEFIPPERMYYSGTALITIEGHRATTLSSTNYDELSSTTLTDQIGHGDTITIRGEHFFIVPEKSGGIRRFAINDLTRSFQTLKRSGTISGIKNSNEKLIVANRKSSIDIYNQTVNSTIEYSHQLDSNVSGPRIIDVRNDSLLVLLPSSLALFTQVSSPDSFHLALSMTYNTNDVIDIKFVPGQGSNFVILKNDQIEFYGIRSGNSIEQINRWVTNHPVTNFYADGKIAAYTLLGDGLSLTQFDSNYEVLESVHLYNSSVVDNIIINKNSLYTFSGTTATIWDISELLTPIQSDQLETGIYVHASLLDKFNRLYITGPKGTKFYSLADSMPTLQAYSELGGSDITYHSDMLSVSNGSSLNMFDVSFLEKSSNQEPLPVHYSLLQNFPNPFNPSTRINYDLPKSGWVKLMVYNIKGREVARLVDRFMQAGQHSVVWNGQNSDGDIAATGVYYYRIKSGDFSQSRKMILLK